MDVHHGDVLTLMTVKSHTGTTGGNVILVDVSHTSHCLANTGIQRVARRIVRELGALAAPVVYDPYAARWRGPDASETALTVYGPQIASGRKRGARWTLLQKCRGGLLAAGLWRGPSVSDSSVLLVPEVFSGKRTREVYAEIRRTKGVRLVTLVHDLIPLTMRDHTPAATVARFEDYLETLRSFDAIAAISEFTRDSLIDYWKGKGLDHPPVVAIPLGVDPAEPVAPPTGRATPVILCVGTLEGRKNHIALLDAAEALWRDGAGFELVLFGGANAETAAPAIAKAERLIQSGYALRWIRGGSDDTMEREYRRATFTVYPSLMEGFGLPVLESLARGVPCVCSGQNAIAETARDGGCLLVGTPTSEALSDAIRDMLEDAALRERLRTEACLRHVRSWADYAADLRAFIDKVAEIKAFA